MLYNIAGHKDKLDAMAGFKAVVTDHITVEVLTLMDYMSDNIKYQNRYTELVNKK